VEDPLWRVSKIIDRLELVKTRMDAAVRVWPEIGRTIHPAMSLVNELLQDLTSLKQALSTLWREGFEVNWK
jgi:hypothetical protein